MKLSIMAISYNEEEKIEEWYSHHKELADEFVLIDTDSIDKTVEIAKKLPIKLVQIKWHHSFAEAKNIGIRHCKGDWILQLSPDYWIDKENFPLIRQAIEAKEKKGFAIPLVHHFESWKGENKPNKIFIKKPTEAHIVLFENNPFIYYENRVHESVNQSIETNFGYNTIGILPVVRHHDSTNNRFGNKEKLHYYEFLEDIAAIERKVWEHGQVLRKKAYDR